jgi:hypothetical protein
MLCPAGPEQASPGQIATANAARVDDSASRGNPETIRPAARAPAITLFWLPSPSVLRGRRAGDEEGTMVDFDSRNPTDHPS